MADTNITVDIDEPKLIIESSTNTVEITEESNLISIVLNPNLIKVVPQTTQVTITAPGIQGPPGPAGQQGEPGPPGPPGSGGGGSSSSYSFTQSSPSAHWHIVHAFGEYPVGISVISGGVSIGGFGRQDPDTNTTDLYFGRPVAGVATLI